mgnify:FL=1
MSSQKIEMLEQHLKQGVQDCFKDGSKYMQFLKTMSKFTSYSPRNCLLIAMQTNGKATYVAGYKKWQSLGRQVQKGSKAIFIFAPYTFKRHLKDGTEEDGIGFFAMPVFDISSTKVVMDDAPVIGLEQIDVPVTEYNTLIQAIIDAAPCPVSFEEFNGTANGYYSPSANSIAVRSSLSESMRIKTLLHEIAHAHLDNPANHQDDAVKDARNVKEIRAESIAFMVSSMLNIQTDDYSFPYIASWEINQDTKQLNAEMQLIKATALRIFEDIQKIRGIEITPVKEVNT